MLLVLSGCSFNPFNSQTKNPAAKGAKETNNKMINWQDRTANIFVAPNTTVSISNLPANWQISNVTANFNPEELSLGWQIKSDTIATVEIYSPQNKNFDFLITFWPEARNQETNEPLTLEDIQRLVVNDSEAVKPRSVEKEITLQGINGSGSQGFYFDPLTDEKYVDSEPAADSGEYRYFMRAGLKLNNSETVAKVTILANQKDLPEIYTFLTTLGEMVLIKK